MVIIHICNNTVMFFLDCLLIRAVCKVYETSVWRVLRSACGCVVWSSSESAVNICRLLGSSTLALSQSMMPHQYLDPHINTNSGFMCFLVPWQTHDLGGFAGLDPIWWLLFTAFCWGSDFRSPARCRVVVMGPGLAILCTSVLHFSQMHVNEEEHRTSGPGSFKVALGT